MRKIVEKIFLEIFESVRPIHQIGPIQGTLVLRGSLCSPTIVKFFWIPFDVLNIMVHSIERLMLLPQNTLGM